MDASKERFRKVHLASLGCAKNQVDSEHMLGRLQRAGWTVTPDPAEAVVIIINTCGFIESAVEESIDTILELAAYKQRGVCRRLIVSGCLPERYRQPIAEALPEVDVFLGTGGFDAIVKAAQGALATGCCYLPPPEHAATPDASSERFVDTSVTAYLKISEGCNRHCTYCIIPRLRGRQQDRPADAIVAEARSLLAAGKKELILVSQETTAYAGDQSLDRLLARLARIDPSVWVRFLYAHPQSISHAVIATVARHENLCSYFDIPIQHTAAAVLKRMGRNYNCRQLQHLFAAIRGQLPRAALRTTLITGFPGESDDDFLQLLDFVREIRFDHLGVFMYSDSQDLASHGLDGHIPREVAQQRYDELMTTQRQISLEINRRYVGSELPVLLEKKLEPGLYQGRGTFQAPDVDGIIYVSTGQDRIGPAIGDRVEVRITDALEYDLTGEAV